MAIFLSFALDTAFDNILDIVITVNGILGTAELTATQIQIADLNSDGVINILDIVLIVNIVLGGS